MLKKLALSWNNYWFRDGSARALSICRIFLIGMIILLRWDEDYRFASELSYNWTPNLYMGFLFPDGMPSAQFIAVLQTIWKISWLTAFVGFFTRFSILVELICGSILMNLVFCVSRTPHEAAPVAICLAILALSRCGDAYSIDAYLRKRRLRSNNLSERNPDYRWPVMLCRLVISIVLCNAGLNKLFVSGPDWIVSDNLARLLLLQSADLGVYISRWPLLCSFFAGVTVLVEIIHPLALFSRRAAYILVPSGILMLVGFRVFMNIPFYLLIVLHVFWVPWDQIFGWWDKVKKL
jgi:hypothetical protein